MNDKKYTWRDKAHSVIYRLCQASYLANNRTRSGKMSCRHIPCSVPQEALDLIDCLNTNDEERAKGMFLFNYAIAKLEGGEK